MCVPPLLRFSFAALLVVFGCQKEAPKPEAEPAPAPPPEAVSAAPAKPAEDPMTPPPSGPPSVPAPPDVAEAPKDAVKTTTGLASKVITKGTGKEHPGPNDEVSVGYAGWTKDGKMFDSAPSDKPAKFGVSGVIPGWTEGLKLMVVGEKRRFWIPAKLAYGERAAMPGAPTGDLVFDVELFDIKKGPETPKDVAKAPKDAKKTASGLAIKTLTKGKGKTHPTASNRVTVHYSGWTKDGKLFDSSVTRGSPSTFSLGQVVKGWTEGLELMVEGEKARLWIPAALAYGETPTPGRPAGDLVFDVELLSIQ